MSTVSIRLSIRDAGTYNRHGQREAFVLEERLGTGEDPKEWGPMPGVAAEAFCRAKRAQFMAEAHSRGYTFILPSRIH